MLRGRPGGAKCGSLGGVLISLGKPRSKLPGMFQYSTRFKCVGINSLHRESDATGFLAIRRAIAPAREQVTPEQNRNKRYER